MPSVPARMYHFFFQECCIKISTNQGVQRVKRLKTSKQKLVVHWISIVTTSLLINHYLMTVSLHYPLKEDSGELIVMFGWTLKNQGSYLLRFCAQQKISTLLLTAHLESFLVKSFPNEQQVKRVKIIEMNWSINFFVLHTCSLQKTCLSWFFIIRFNSIDRRKKRGLHLVHS